MSNLAKYFEKVTGLYPKEILLSGEEKLEDFVKSSEFPNLIIKHVMEMRGITRNTILYRCQEKEFINPSLSIKPNEIISGSLNCNKGSVGSVMDIYHFPITLKKASQLPSPDNCNVYVSTFPFIGYCQSPKTHVMFFFRLSDILDQGGKIYSDRNYSDAYIVTVPSGFIRGYFYQQRSDEDSALIYIRNLQEIRDYLVNMIIYPSLYGIVEEAIINNIKKYSPYIEKSLTELTGSGYIPHQITIPHKFMESGREYISHLLRDNIPYISSEQFDKDGREYFSKLSSPSYYFY